VPEKQGGRHNRPNRFARVISDLYARIKQNREIEFQSKYPRPESIYIHNIGRVHHEGEKVQIPRHTEENYYQRGAARRDCPSTSGKVVAFDIRVYEDERGKNHFFWVARVACDRSSSEDPRDFCNASWEEQTPISN